MMNFSASSLDALHPSQQEAAIRSLTPEEAEQLLYDWRFWARAKQVAPPGEWLFWLILAGRGFGKTRTGAEWIRERVDAGAQNIIIAGATAGDVRDIMVEGESGILATSPPWARPRYEPSKARLTWPTGARAMLMSADEPERFRGKQCDTFWADELAAWRQPTVHGSSLEATQKAGTPESWTQLTLNCRLPGKHNLRPRGIVTTTPKAIKVIRDLLTDPRTVPTRGSTFENAANLAPEAIALYRAKYEGTRLGRQELHAEVLEDVEGALWSHDLIERHRVAAAPPLFRTVVAIDPAVTATETSDETGIIVAGLGVDHQVYVLADLSGRHSPNEWARRAVQAYADFGADRIVAEQNNGGQLVEVNLRTIGRHVAYKAVHAAQGKRTRAEPVAALYEQGRVHHVGLLDKLEDQQCSWEPLTGAKSPDRLDALVWAVSELMFQPTVRRDFRNLPPG